MKELKLINPENVSEKEAEAFPVREAVRAIVVDENGMIALLHVSTDGYYKLPGGGIEDTEDRMVALRRECQEEIGCDIEIIKEIGSIVEYRKKFNLKQISYCYVAKVKDKKRVPNFTEEELGAGFKQVWLSYEDAKRAVAESRATTYEGSTYIVPRDTVFLAEAREHLANIT